MKDIVKKICRFLLDPLGLVAHRKRMTELTEIEEAIERLNPECLMLLRSVKRAVDEGDLAMAQRYIAEYNEIKERYDKEVTERLSRYMETKNNDQSKK